MEQPQTVSKIFRQAAALLLCLAASAFPLFGNDTEALTKTLRETIYRIRRSETTEFEAINRLLEAGADANGIYNTSTGDTFLIEAASQNNVVLAQLLMEHGADPALPLDPKLQFSGGNSAVFYGNKEITSLFISRGARFDVINAKGKSPLNRLHEGTSAVLILEWEQEHSPGFSANFESREEYLTDVLAELLRGSLEDKNSEKYIIAKRLLEAGANPAAMYEDRFPVAYLAVNAPDGYSGNWLNFIPLLVEYGAPVDAFTGRGRTVLYCAVDEDIYKSAPNPNSYKLAAFLLDHGADPNQQNKNGRTALMATAESKKKEAAEVMRLLLDSGADPNLQDEEGNTALTTAKSAEMISLLLDSGADPNLRNKYGNTAFMNIRNPEFISLFFQAGADPTLKNNNGRTVLHFRGYSSWLWWLDGPIIDELISRGCLIDEPDKNGFTPLLRAVSAGSDYHKAALALLEKGADPHCRDPKGRNALHLYLLELEKHPDWYDKDGEPSFVAALLEAGIRPADKDDEGDSALRTVNRISRKKPDMIPLRNLVLQYADAQDAKIAKKTEAKIASAAKREEFSKDLPDILKALSVPIAWGGLSVLMREVVYKDDPYKNFMGWVNGATTLGISGFFLFGIFGSGGRDWAAGILTGALGAIVGTIVASIPSVIRTFNKNPLLYYIAPAAIGVIAITVEF
jgi:ankyrin repeat protein